MQGMKIAKRNIMRDVASNSRGSDLPAHAPDIRLVIDSTPALIHTGLPDGYLDFLNQPWLRYVGRSLGDLEGWKWTASIHPEDVEGIRATLKETKWLLSGPRGAATRLGVNRSTL